jgi:hypothetical protein
MSHRVGRLAYDGLTHGVVTIRRTLSDVTVTWCRLSVGGLQMRGAVYYPTYEDATMPVDCIACLANEPVTHPPIVAVFTV